MAGAPCDGMMSRIAGILAAAAGCCLVVRVRASYPRVITNPEPRMPRSADPIAGFLDREGVLILDGGLATELEKRGADLDDPLWSARLLIEDPDLIRQVHHDYYAAGADVAVTASYQASFA